MCVHMLYLSVWTLCLFVRPGPPLVQQKLEEDNEEKEEIKGERREEWEGAYSEWKPIELNVIWPECAQPSAALQSY